ncbi:hypothetical protein X798_00532 [Onchocerca flexuosa]|uniref:Uncharacterized protein n=1 Tax=Onchocerca flexuosa TaxID=387005 RepID=A0A238C618_9BILA|nr:hypothetical protein X798_00532 [Onchocerca flexuosa]
MKSFLREIESKLYIIEKNQQAMLKLLESSVDNEGNSKNLGNTEVVRRNDSIIMERELFTGKRESGNYGIYANISKSDEEEKRKLHCLDELTKTCNVYQIAKRFLVPRSEEGRKKEASNRQHAALQILRIFAEVESSYRKQRIVK